MKIPYGCQISVYLPIYIVRIFKAVVTNTFGTDFEVLCFKLQTRNDLKNEKKDKSVPVCCQNMTSFFHSHMDYIDYTS